MYCVFVVQGSQKVLLDMFFNESEALSYVDKVRTWNLHGSIVFGFISLSDLQKIIKEV